MTSETDFKYRKIGRFKGIFSRSAFFVGDDHFLLVINQHFSENYRRFYFNEIEGITLRKTTRGRNLTILFSILLALFGIPAFFVSEEGAIVLVVMAAFPLVLLLVNLVLGTTVECVMRTTASQETLPMVSRLRRYHKFLPQVRHYIEASQGGSLEQFHLIARFGTNSAGPATA